MEINWIKADIKNGFPAIKEYGYSEPCLIKVYKDGKIFIPSYTYEVDTNDYDWERNCFTAKWVSSESHCEYADEYAINEVIAYIPINEIKLL